MSEDVSAYHVRLMLMHILTIKDEPKDAKHLRIRVDVLRVGEHLHLIAESDGVRVASLVLFADVAIVAQGVVFNEHHAASDVN